MKVSSHSDRRIEFFISDVLMIIIRHIDHFGKDFLEQWDDDEYNQFYNTMIMAIQYYLEKGLVEPELGQILLYTEE